MFGRLREKYQKIMEPVGNAFSRTGLTPNIVTLFSLLTGFITGYAYYSKSPIIGVLFIFITGFFDMVDGAIARAKNKVTKFGATLDHVLDRYVEFLLIMGIILGGYVEWSFGVIALFGMLMASFTRAKAESVGGLKSCTVGIAERQEKLLIIIVGSILATLFPNVQPLNYAVMIVGFLSHITVIQRLKYTWEQTGGN